MTEQSNPASDFVEKYILDNWVHFSPGRGRLDRPGLLHRALHPEPAGLPTRPGRDQPPEGEVRRPQGAGGP